MFGVMQRKILMLPLVLALAGCISQSDIQAKYVKQQNVCRGEASRFVSSLGASAATPDGQSAAGVQFSECMNKSGWRVAMPKPGPTPTGPAPNPPSGSPSTDPIASIGRQVPAENPTATRPVAQQPPQQVATGPAPNPPSGSPSTNPIAAAKASPPAETVPVQKTPSSAVPTTTQTTPPTKTAAMPPPAKSPPPPASPDTTLPPAQYQPARPMSVPSAPYGRGAGRQF